MKCPHCLDSFFEAWEGTTLGKDDEGYWHINHTKCPTCDKWIVKLIKQRLSGSSWRFDSEYLVRPIAMSRSPLPKDVPEKYSKVYIQASNVLPISPEASAALSRRCLQILLRDEAHVSPGNLGNEIQQVIDSGTLPSILSESIDAIRNIGNFAAHPMKSTNTGEIIEVEAGEAEWNLDVLEELIDHYLVKPAKLAAKRDALNQKLQDAGKNPMK